MPRANPPRVVSLDLDDTLWPIMPVILEAEASLRRWLAEQFPRVVQRYSPHQMRALRDAINAAHPERAHDLGWLRLRTLAAALESAGYRDPEAAAADGLAVFLAARNRVELYDDVRPALERLARRHLLVALTNGNADLEQIGLAQLFRHRLTAADIGAAKPDRQMFGAVCEATGAAPEEILHAGDDPLRDVVGAAREGFATAWINRESAHWPAEYARPDLEVPDMGGLVRLLER